MLRVLSDVLTAADAQQVTMLGLLDLSAAFDCVDHQLLQRLRRDFGFTETVLAWTTSFVTGRTQQVQTKQGLPFSCSTCLVWGPTGICPWPHTVFLYTVEIGRIVAQHWLMFHQYADDCQIYVATSVSAVQCHRPAFALSSRRRCLDEFQPTTPERQQDTCAVAQLPA